MTTKAGSSNKAKIARRVIEVLEFFDDMHNQATVMDIVRRYNRPQSSTSELLSSLVELGLLYKDPQTRSYSLAPRAGLLGSAGQVGMVRDGRLVRLVDRLVTETGLGVILFGRVGLRVQIVMIRGQQNVPPQLQDDLSSGMQVPLTSSAAGLLLLSTLGRQQREGMVRRINAEAVDGARFSTREILSEIDQCVMTGTCNGTLGFADDCNITAGILPYEHETHALVLGFIGHPGKKAVAEELYTRLDEAVRQELLAIPKYPGYADISVKTPALSHAA